VGARLGFGHQTEPQALLAVGALVPPALDLLWSRGQLGDPARVCEAAGVDPTVLSEVRALASVRRVATLTEEASFMPALVEMTFPRVRGTRAVRAAFEALPAVPATAWVRCRDVSAAEPFLAGADERTFLASLGEFRAAEALSAVQSALLRALEHAGLVEILSPEEWEARAGAERVEAARRAEEDTRREAARHALEAARAAEEHRQAGMRDRADAARRALESARAAEADWRKVREGNGDAERPEVRTTEHEFPAGTPARETSREFGAPPPIRTTELEFHALSEDMPPLEPPATESVDGPVPVLTRTTLPPFEAPVPGTDPMGARRSRPRWVTRTRWSGQRSRRAAIPIRTRRCRRCPLRRPAAPILRRPPAPAPTPTLRGRAARTARRTPTRRRSLATRRRREPTRFPRRRRSPSPSRTRRPAPSGEEYAEARTPPGGVVLESEELVLEPEALMLSTPRASPRPPRAPWSRSSARRSAPRRVGGAPGSLPGSQHRGGGQQAAERTPLRLGPEAGEPRPISGSW
jgi:hypothetical protein